MAIYRKWIDKIIGTVEQGRFIFPFKKAFSQRLAYYWSELNVLHPFREGNGRTTREFMRQIALKYNYRLNLHNVDAKDILNASIKSIIDVTDLENIIYKCLEPIK